MSDHVITKEGYDKLKEELDQLINIKRKEIADRIEKAKELGDLSENAEYSEAKDAQAFNEGRIAEITATLKNSTVVKTSRSKTKVSLGSKITIKTGNKQKQYTIVSFNEADPLEGKISNESPLGLAFLNKKQGEIVIVNTPKGEVKYRILEIE